MDSMWYKLLASDLSFNEPRIALIALKSCPVERIILKEKETKLTSTGQSYHLPPPPPHHHHLSFSFDKDNLSSWVVFFFHPNPLVVESLDEMLAMASVIIWIILMGIMMTMLMLNKESGSSWWS